MLARLLGSPSTTDISGFSVGTLRRWKNHASEVGARGEGGKGVAMGGRDVPMGGRGVVTGGKAGTFTGGGGCGVSGLAPAGGRGAGDAAGCCGAHGPTSLAAGTAGSPTSDGGSPTPTPNGGSDSGSGIGSGSASAAHAPASPQPPERSCIIPEVYDVQSFFSSTEV